MFCQNCGKKAEEIGKFCNFCGKETGFLTEEETAVVQEQTQSPVLSYTTNKKLSKKQKVIMLSCGLLLILVIILQQLGSYFSNPQTIAKSYFAALSKADYSNAFNYLYLPESQLLTKESYVNYMQKIYGTSPWVVTYKINNTDSSPKSNNLNRNSTKDLLSQDIRISYIDKNANMQKSLGVNLIKSGDKKYLFFDNWKVNLVNMLQSTWSLTVPKGASLYVNGIEIPRSDIKQNTSSNSNSSYNPQHSNEPKTEVFEVKNIFPGDYDIKVTMPNAKDYNEKYNSANHYINITLLPDENLEATIKKIINEYNQNCIMTANKKDLNIVKGLVLENSYAWENLQSFFNNLNGNEQYTLKSIKFEDIYLDDESHVRIKDIEDWESNLYSGARSYNLTYKLQKVNGKWLIYHRY